MKLSKPTPRARDAFERLGEPNSIATAWHQIGMVYAETGDLEGAEAAYQQSLRIKLGSGNKSGEASTRNQLGILCNLMPGRREDAVAFFRQAADISAAPAFADPFNEGLFRSNAANALISLGRHAEARAQVQRAVECKSTFGHNAEPWTTWDILHDLETAEGNVAAAAEARSQAIASYAAARRNGWERVLGHVARFSDLVRAILAARNPATSADVIPPEVHREFVEAERQLRADLTALVSDANVSPDSRAAAQALLAILDGSRDPALANDPALFYADAVELGLLLESL
jgi:tetratricopeptide (TPR) repeat protein